MAAPDLELSTMAVVLLFIATLILLCAIACLVQCGRVKRAGGAASTKCAAAGAGTRTPMAPVSDERYPFYAMTVKEILSLTDWHPHQHLLADGKLINLTADPAAGTRRGKGRRPARAPRRRDADEEEREKERSALHGACARAVSEVLGRGGGAVVEKVMR